MMPVDVDLPRVSRLGFRGDGTEGFRTPSELQLCVGLPGFEPGTS
jgi:hypothetical protein